MTLKLKHEGLPVYGYKENNANYASSEIILYKMYILHMLVSILWDDCRNSMNIRSIAQNFLDAIISRGSHGGRKHQNYISHWYKNSMV